MAWPRVLILSIGLLGLSVLPWILGLLSSEVVTLQYWAEIILVLNFIE